MAKETRIVRIPKMTIVQRSPESTKKPGKTAILAQRLYGQKWARSAELTKIAKIARMAKIAKVPKRRRRPD